MPTNEENDRRAIGRRLKETREYLALSQDEVSKALDIPRTAISLLESGERKVDAIELGKLASIYQQPVDYFLSGKTSATETPKDVALLARAASKMTREDRDELLRFAQFLQSKSKST